MELMKRAKKLFDNRIDVVALVLICVLFGYFAIFHGTYEYGDSFQYAHQYPMREPVYSLLIQFFQIIAHDNYMLPLGIFQNILAVICVYWTYIRLCRIYKLNSLFRLGTVALLLAPHIITPVASQTHMILTNSVMTEGITMSLYYVWFTILLGILADYYDEKNQIIINVISVCLAMLLALTRGQMAVCLILWLIVSVYKALVQFFANKSDSYRIKGIAKKLLIYVVILAIVFVAKSQITKIYNQLETGYYVDTVSSKPMLLANIAYVCDESDADYINDADLKEAFRTIVSNAKNDGYSVGYATGSVIDRALYHEKCHDILNFEYIDPEIRKVIYKQGIDEDKFLSLMIEEDRICGDMSKALLPNIATKYLKNYFVIVALGFVRSVAIEKFGLSIVAVLMYIFAIVLCVYGAIKRKAGKQIISMLLVLIAICGTVCGTSLMIQCIGRYMIYNLPFFYIVGMALLQALFMNGAKE